jgi:hypothetical protein
MRRSSSSSHLANPVDGDGDLTRPLNSMPAPKQKSTKGLQAIAARFPTFSNKARPDDAPRRATVPCEGPSPAASQPQRKYSSLSLSSTKSTPALPTYSPSPAPLSQARTVDLPLNVNLDYLPLGDEDHTTHTSSTITLPTKPMLSSNTFSDASWEQIVTNIDSGYPGFGNSHTTINPAAVSPGSGKLLQSMSGNQEWAPPAPPSLDESWPSLSAVDLSRANKVAVPRSVLSFSEESWTSGEDLVFSAAGSNATTDSTDLSDANTPSGFKGIAMPTGPIDDDFGFGSEFDGSY